MWHDEEVMDHVLMAAGERCPNDCYEYEQQFGSVRVRVANRSLPLGFEEWVWYYTDPRSKIDEYEKQIKAAIAAAR
jgi:hypothetical protein